MRFPIAYTIPLALLLAAPCARASYYPSDPDANDFIIPDPLNPGQFLSRQWAIQRLNIPEAWQYTRGSTDVTIAVIDTGIVFNTPDLQPNPAVPGSGDILPPLQSLGIGNTQTGPNPPARPDLGTAQDPHGTWVTSVIDMTPDNGIGSAGVGNFAIQPIRATSPSGSSSTTSDQWIENAIDAASQQGCRVITISLSAFSYGAINAEVAKDLAANKAAGRPDFLVFMAAGNSNISSSTDDPALNDAKDGLNGTNLNDHIIFVTGTNEADRNWEFSYDPNNPSTIGSANGPFVDLAAPAQDIWVANGTTVAPGLPYGFINGTSFSSPYAASEAAMIWSVNPTLTAAQVQEIMFDTAYNPDRPANAPAGPFWDSYFGWGRIDIGAAVADAATLPGSIVPEPASLLLLATGCAALLTRTRRRGTYAPDTSAAPSDC